jgi:hypothetical protein
MKIRDIIIEGDVGDIANISKNNFSKGFDTVNKLLSPSQWFKGGSSNTDTTDKPTPVKKKAPNTLHLEKQSLNRVASGAELYPEDIQYLKSIYSKVVKGKVRSEYDSRELADTIKMAYQSRPLTAEQKAMLTNFSKSL